MYSTGTETGHFLGTSLEIYNICKEEWPYPSLHIVYSVCVMLVQYIIPITVIAVTHAKIIKTVQKRTFPSNNVRWVHFGQVM